ncbi:Zn(2)-Cys(6) zinc finger domain protein [Metarhizium robertsii]|uniref:Zn(2)-Cys(6) zinc finger domain protein n=1 Tax=Metarhizium robertsii TaxID=568076 RepID=A0A0A1UN89_9HYPO|nr:Zn(2)-Cys(6) zinc finger domain protein [Metarhizium robertsii]
MRTLIPGEEQPKSQTSNESQGGTSSLIRRPRYDRVREACERCRVKKSKCDNGRPCSRCKDDGVFCTTSTGKKKEYKQPPPGYAEILENNHYTLIATIYKLYDMVRSNQSWDRQEPDLNQEGQPVIHTIARLLGCARHVDDTISVRESFPETESDMVDLACQLLHHQRSQGQSPPATDADGSLPSSLDSPPYEPTSQTTFLDTAACVATVPTPSFAENSDEDSRTPSHNLQVNGPYDTCITPELFLTGSVFQDWGAGLEPCNIEPYDAREIFDNDSMSQGDTIEWQNFLLSLLS